MIMQTMPMTIVTSNGSDDDDDDNEDEDDVCLSMQRRSTRGLLFTPRSTNGSTQKRYSHQHTRCLGDDRSTSMCECVCVCDNNRLHKESIDPWQSDFSNCFHFGGVFCDVTP